MSPQLSHVLIYRRIIFDYKSRKKERYYIVQTWVVQGLLRQREFKVRVSIKRKLGIELSKVGRAQKEDGFIHFGDPVVEVESKARMRRGK